MSKKLSKEEIQFIEKYGEMSDSEILKEILRQNIIQTSKLERTRSNTSAIVWWFIAIPLIGALIVALLAGAGIAFN